MYKHIKCILWFTVAIWCTFYYCANCSKDISMWWRSAVILMKILSFCSLFLFFYFTLFFAKLLIKHLWFQTKFYVNYAFNSIWKMNSKISLRTFKKMIVLAANLKNWHCLETFSFILWNIIPIIICPTEKRLEGNASTLKSIFF